MKILIDRRLRKILNFCFLLFLIILPFSGNCSGELSESDILVYNTKDGFLTYKKNKYRQFKSNLPKRAEPIDIEISPEGTVYLATLKHGIFRSQKNISDWTNISSEDFKRRTILKDVNEYRKISAIHANIDGKLLLSTKHRIYSSTDDGKTWESVSLKGLTDWKYVNALTYSSNGNIVAGTAKHAIYIRKNSRFRKHTKGLPVQPVTKTYNFYESVSVIEKNGPTLFAGFHFGKGLYMSNNQGISWNKLNLPLKKDSMSAVYDIAFSEKNIYVATGEGIFFSDDNGKKWELHPKSNIVNEIFRDSLNRSILISVDNVKLFIKNEYFTKDLYIIQNSKASNKNAVYTNVHKLRKNIDYFINLCNQTEINSVVIDVKDDTGNIYLPVKNKYAHKIGAVKRSPDWDNILKKFHDNNIYIIARFVVFKDKKLYRSENYKYSIKDRRNGKPWKGLPHEYWCDPFSEFVQNYNLDLAEETANAGFDEIQFDYIRFPADGGVLNCKYTFGNANDKFKSEVLADFLERAQNRISKPISADIYGFNAFYIFGNIIGQDVEVFAQYTDALSPMVYPSHYGNRFFKDGPRYLRPYKIVFHNTARAKYLCGYKTRMRPYIQAFNLLSPTWGPGYIKQELRGIKESKSDGYIFWNAGGDYSTVKKALKK